MDECILAKAEDGAVYDREGGACEATCIFGDCSAHARLLTGQARPGQIAQRGGRSAARRRSDDARYAGSARDSIAGAQGGWGAPGQRIGIVVAVVVVVVVDAAGGGGAVAGKSSACRRRATVDWNGRERAYGPIEW